QHVAGDEPDFMRPRTHQIYFGGVFDGDAGGRARQVIEQLFPRFRIEPNLHLHATERYVCVYAVSRKFYKTQCYFRLRAADLETARCVKSKLSTRIHEACRKRKEVHM